MLPSRNRLTAPGDFRQVVRRGRRSGGHLVVVHLHVPTAGAASSPVPRVGFVVSRAVGPAVTRNLVKRRLRHLTSARLGALPERGMLVVRATPAAAVASYAELGGDFDRGLDRCLDKARGSVAAPVVEGATT